MKLLARTLADKKEASTLNYFRMWSHSPCYLIVSPLVISTHHFGTELKVGLRLRKGPGYEKLMRLPI